MQHPGQSGGAVARGQLAGFTGEAGGFVNVTELHVASARSSVVMATLRTNELSKVSSDLLA